MVHDLQIGKSSQSKLFNWFITHFVFNKRKQKAQDRHAKEEFKNLESLMK